MVEQRIIKLHLNGSIAQRIEQQPSKLWVDGLNPSGVTIGPVAQLVEQYTFNVWVSGSNPDGITITKGYIKLRQTRALEPKRAERPVYQSIIAESTCTSKVR